MTQRHVDVLNQAGKVLHTYPITLGTTVGAPVPADYERAALSEAAKAKLVPESDIAHLTARMHPQKGGTAQASVPPAAGAPAQAPAKH